MKLKYLQELVKQGFVSADDFLAVTKSLDGEEFWTTVDLCTTLLPQLPEDAIIDLVQKLQKVCTYHEMNVYFRSVGRLLDSLVKNPDACELYIFQAIFQALPLPSLAQAVPDDSATPQPELSDLQQSEPSTLLSPTSESDVSS